jgi:hypothetical protein
MINQLMLHPFIRAELITNLHVQSFTTYFFKALLTSVCVCVFLAPPTPDLAFVCASVPSRSSARQRPWTFSFHFLS